MSQLLERYRSYIRYQRDRGAETTRKYMAVLFEFASWLEARGFDRDLACVGKAELVEFLMLPGTKHEPSPVRWNARLAPLRSFYGYLYKEELVKENPTLKIERHKVKSKKPLPLDFDEYLDLIDGLGKSSPKYRARNVALGTLMFQALLRVQSVVSLDLEQVDLQAHALINVRLKGGKYETLEINDLTCDALERYLADRPSFVRDPAERAFFLSDRGTRLSVRQVQEIIPKAGSAAGIQRRVRCHLLRHSGATELNQNGVDIRTIQGLCDHESILTTQTYVHLRGGETKRALKKLDELTRARQRTRSVGAAPNVGPVG